MPAPACKGNLFNGYVTTARKIFSSDVFEQVYAEVAVESRHLIRTPPVATDWLPFERLDELANTIVRIAYNYDVTRYSELARGRMLRDLTGLYRVFVKMLSPSFVTSRTALIWTQYHRDNGQMRAEVAIREGELGFQEREIHLMADG